MMTSEILRTDVEIVQRIRDIQGADWMKTTCTGLFCYLSLEALRPFCKPDADLSELKAAPPTRNGVLELMRDYIEFALCKAMQHRGFSAGRSIDHFKAWVWLLGDYAEIDWGNHQNYGMPILRQICERYGFAFANADEATRMANGERCRQTCKEGCGS